MTDKEKIARLEKINLALVNALETVKRDCGDGTLMEIDRGEGVFGYDTTEIQKALDMAVEYHDEP